MPRIYRHLGDILSPEAMNALVEHFAGQQVWIPTADERLAYGHRMRPPSPKLAEVLGQEQVDKLSRVYGGEYVYVPFKPRKNRQTDWQKVMEMHRAGAKINDIVVALGVGRRTIFRWLKKPINTVLGSSARN
jgi:hypothetical protein